MMTDKGLLSQFIKAEAIRLGFDVCGIAKAGTVTTETTDFCNKWIDEGKHGTLHYIAYQVMPWAKTITRL